MTGKIFLIAFLISFTTCNLWCQKNSTSNLENTEFFVGSTPCDSLIKSILEVRREEKCEFIKWELNLNKPGNNTAGSFQLTVLYGESLPNTNGFKDGKKILLNGNYTTQPGNNTGSPGRTYYLKASNLRSPIILIEMNNNIFHFADLEKKLLVGNGGWGYVLNRSK